MRKNLILGSCLALSVLLAGCNSSNNAGQTVTLNKPIIQNDETDNGVMIAYFSRIGNIDSEYEIDAISSASVVVQGENILGNTEYMADLIQKEVGGDIHFIETEDKYSSHYDSSDDNKLDVQTEEEHRNNARPTLASQIENMEDYDVIFLGFPNWWSDMPMAVYSFLDEYDLSGKKVYLFNTSGGGGAANALSEVKKLEPDAEVNQNILTVTHSEIGNFTETDVKEWLEEIEYQP